MSDAPQHPIDDDLNPTELPATTKSADAERADEIRIGPYRLLDKLGEGGMGEVWLAEQTEPVKRKVALKLIKLGMDTKQVVARFEAERQALAMMDHPAIARVFDAGATPEGRPYFAMEHVRGVPITEHCDRHKLSNRQRLDLFLQVCEGVQHAHHKAVIHRDLKPSNVLVAIRNDRPVPKIIDFGVAKATAHKLTEQTMHTQLGVMIGTPAYMSPEQAEMTGQDIDTRTDVYALGVMLYELLVGALPFDTKQFLEAGLDEIVRKIREDEPPRPSARLTTLGEHSTQSAKCRQTELPALKRELSGDLDWITLKALEKDRTRRYDSPKDLAADIERYLTDQPVLASPPSAAYRAKKFVRRHTGGVIAAAAGTLMLVAFAVTMAVQARHIATERDRANAEAARANREAEAKGQVSEFLKGLFTVSNPGEARGNSITARELLDKGAEEIEGTLADQPETRAELMSTMGTVYRNLGLYSQAEPLFDRSLAERERVLGADHPDTLTARHNLAVLYMDQGRYDEAVELDREILEARMRVLGDGHRDTLLTMNNLAVLYRNQGRYDDAEPLYVEALGTQRRVLGDDHTDTLMTMNNLAELYRNQGRHDAAEPLHLEALKTRKRALGHDHPHTLVSMNNLAELYRNEGRYDEAEPLYLEALEIQERVLGDDHPYNGIIVHNLGCLARDAGRPEPARERFERAQRVFESKLGPDHPLVAENLSQWAGLLRKTGDDAGAEGMEARAAAIRGK